MRHHAFHLLLFLVLLLLPGASIAQSAAEPVVVLPKHGLEPRELAVIVNESDPQSRIIGSYYRKKRDLPPENVIRVRFKPGEISLSAKEFSRLRLEVERQTPPRVQAYALAWTRPVRAGCMSVTAAFALGYDQAYCADGCKTTRKSDYFASPSSMPFPDHGLRPTMMLAGESFADVKALIDRGVASDGTWPEGTAYLARTSDPKRTVREVLFPRISQKLGGLVRIEEVTTDALEGRDDVLFHFTGRHTVEKINTLGFVPGAMADHLTSYGGLPTGFQMPALLWLRAGATGSYGTVHEPCNFLQKFPHPGVAMLSYLTGETLVEAYWKSVAMPGQGVFLGEPLARPFGGTRLVRREGRYVARTRSLLPGPHSVLFSRDGLPPYRTVNRFVVLRPEVQEIPLPDWAGAGDVFLVRRDRDQSR